MTIRYTFACAFLLHLLDLHAQDGVLDPAFGTNGVVVADAGKSDILRDITLQPDGRIVGTGWAYDETHTDLLVARFTSSGALDNTFGANGVVILPTGSGFSGAEAVNITGDGKILVAGYSNNGVNNGFTVWRFTSAGVLDATFGTGGTYTDFSHASGSFITDMELLPDGHIVITGPVYTGTFCGVGISRLTAIGTLDATFGTGGRFEHPSNPTTNWTPNALKVLSDGRCVVAGQTQNTTTDPLFLRVTSAGVLDATFDGDGVRTIENDMYNEYLYNLVVRPDGRYLATGEALNSADYDVFLAQVDATGANSAFGSSGPSALMLPHGTNEYCRGTAVLPDGRILAAGSMATSGGALSFLLRTTVLAEADNSFGAGGWLGGEFGDWTYAEAMLVQPDGKAVIAGNTASGGAPYDMMLARYIVSAPAGVDEQAAATQIVLFPDPVMDQAVLRTNARITSVLVTDASGRPVRVPFTREDNGVRLDAGALACGSYVVVLDGPDGRMVQRFVKR